MPYCVGCGTQIEEWDSGYYARQMMCISCYNRKQDRMFKKMCVNCGNVARPEQGGEINGHFYCSDCYRSETKAIAKRTCHVCKRVLDPWEKRVVSPDGKTVCEKCFAKGPGRMGMRVSVGRPAQQSDAPKERSSLVGTLVSTFTRVF